MARVLQCRDGDKAAAKHEHNLSGGAYAQGTIVHRWRQKLSVMLQKALSVTTERLFLKTRAVSGRPRPVVKRHESVHLLVRPVVQEQYPQYHQQPVGVGLGAVSGQLRLATLETRKGFGASSPMHDEILQCRDGDKRSV